MSYKKAYDRSCWLDGVPNQRLHWEAGMRYMICITWSRCPLPGSRSRSPGAVHTGADELKEAEGACSWQQAATDGSSLLGYLGDGTQTARRCAVNAATLT